jgi:hypothetical protein
MLYSYGSWIAIFVAAMVGFVWLARTLWIRAHQGRNSRESRSDGLLHTLRDAERVAKECGLEIGAQAIDAARVSCVRERRGDFIGARRAARSIAEY